MMRRLAVSGAGLPPGEVVGSSGLLLAQAGWNPAIVPYPLELWLKSSDPNTIDHTDGKVANWLDKSGLDRHFTQPTEGLRPLTGIRSRNGRNVIDFTPPQRMYRDPFWRSLSASTTFVVCAADASSGQATLSGILMEHLALGFNAEYGIRLFGSGGVVEFIHFNGSVQIIISRTFAYGGQWQIISVVDAGTAASLRVNADETSGSYTRANVSRNRIGLGGYTESGSNVRSLDGAIAEVLVWDGAMTQEWRDVVHAALAAEYAI